jgi:hypothetical protein
MEGSVTVTGTAGLGQTLSANISVPWDGGAITYQWQRYSSAGDGFVPINGATSNTYTLASADTGKYIRVVVGCAGYMGTIVSVPVLVGVSNNVLTGSVTISGTPMVGRVLSANTDALGGTGAITYALGGTEAITYQWQRANSANGSFAPIDGATSNTYTLLSADMGKYVRVEVEHADYAGTKASDPVVVQISSLGTITINGLAAVGQVLSVNIDDLGGSGAITYQWQRFDAATNGYTNLSSDPGNPHTYTPVQADVGKYIWVTVSRAGSVGTVNAGVGPIETSVLSGSVTIDGAANAVIGTTLTVNTGAVGGTGQLSYQWQRNGRKVFSTDPQNPFDFDVFVDIYNATSPTYTITSEDVSSYIRVVVSRAGHRGTLTKTVGPAAIKSLSSFGKIELDGFVGLGQPLTAKPLAGVNPSYEKYFHYQWQSSPENGSFTDIPGATSATYTPDDADANMEIRLVLTCALGYSGSTSSGVIGPIGPNYIGGAISITGNTHAGQVLTAKGIGLATVSTANAAYHWQRSDTANGQYQTFVAQGPTYTLASADIGKYIRVVANLRGYTPIISAPVGPIATPFLTGKVTIDGAANAVIGSTLTANTSALDGSGKITYIWEAAETLEGPWRTTTYADYNPQWPEKYVLNLNDARGGLYTGPDKNRDNFDLYGDYAKHIRVRVSRLDRTGEVISEPTHKIMDLSVTIEQLGYASDNLNGVTSAYYGSTAGTARNKVNMRWAGTNWTEWSAQRPVYASYSVEWQVCNNGMNGPWKKASDHDSVNGYRRVTGFEFEPWHSDRNGEKAGGSYIRVQVTQHYPNWQHPIIRYSPPAGRLKPYHMIGWY